MRFPAEPWMTAGSRARLFAALGAPGVDVRYVGGVVRNWLMGQAVGEIDLATPDVPARVMERLAQAGIRAIPTGIDHGTVTAVIDGETFEITTLRRDTACDGRHAAVEFTADWQEDARRRDFTINAMSLRPDGTLFDDHDGRADAAAGRVRFVGAPADRIQEDYLRILRLFRFVAWYGRVPIEPAALEAVRAHVTGLAHLSAERIAQEMTKLLMAPDPAPAVMADSGVLGAIFPDAADPRILAALVGCEQRWAVAPDWRRRLAALASGDSGAVIAARLKLSNADAARLALLTAAGPALSAASSPREIDHALYRLGAPVVRDRLLLAAARAADSVGESPGFDSALTRVRTWTEKSLPVSGADVLALGIAPGPKVGALLQNVEAWWIDAGFAPDRSQALAELRRIAGV